VTDEDIERVARAMLACTLPKAEWTHTAHFAAALWLIRARGVAAARTDMPGLIRRYNESAGGRNTDTEGYHETITQASLHMAARAIQASEQEAPLSDVLAGLMAGPCGRSDWIFTYWSQDRLSSVEARRSWLPPDRQDLPD
jgi:hypothetical protein